MYATRTFLLLLMVFILLTMLSFPSYYDTRRMTVAVQHHISHPTRATQLEISEADKQNHKEIVIWEAAFGLSFIFSAIWFTRLGKNIYGNRRT